MITINEFYEIFTQNIFFTADTRSEMMPQSFFEVICETLVESGDLTLNYSPSPYQKTGLEVSGWDFDEDRKVLTLLVCEQFISNDIETLSKQAVDTKFKRLYNFYEKSINRFYENLEETSDAFALAFSIYDKAIKKDFNKVKLVLLTNGKLTKNINVIESKELYGIKIEHQIIDIEYLYKTSLSNYIEEDVEIEVDIPCLRVDTSDKYSSFLAVINGETICNIYENLGKKVLDENVRTFLQFKGGVNKGIRNTIEYKPEYFFAYNNGITATAKSIELNKEQNKIIKIKNLHIVNGGQTTSSIYRSKLDLKKDVSNIFVQMKLSLVKENNDYQEFVQNISRFANTQNKVNESDLFSNHEFHKEFSKYSKKIWAPPKANQQKKTRWFYERVRGEYLNDLATCGTVAKKNNFKQEAPKEQVIDKVFLAKSENVWNLKPVEVCKGAQYSFKTFAEEIVKEYDKNNEMITEIYFKNAVARVIIFKRLEKIISKSDWYDGGYRAQVVAYTLAYIANYLKTNGIFFNFNLIWESQDICDDLEKALKDLSYKIYKIIMCPEKGYSNIGEWCKKNICWETIKSNDLNFKVPKDYILEKDEFKEIVKKDKKNKREEAKIDYLVEIANIETEVWEKIYTHYDKYKLMSETQLNLLRNMANGKFLDGSFYPSDKQSKLIFDGYKTAKNDGIV